MSDQSFYTISETAARVERYCWIEQKLCGLMGVWARESGSAEATYLLGTQSFHHQFLAELWAKRLPELRSAASGVPQQQADSQIVEVLAPGFWADQPLLVKLALLYRTLLPRMAASYEQHKAKTDEQTDAATRRILDLCLHDYRADWPKGEFLLQSMQANSDEILEIFGAQQRLELLLANRFGLVATAT